MSDQPEIDRATLKRRIPIPFYTTIGANGATGLASDMITFPYKIVRVQAHFRDDAANLLQVWAFVSRNNNAVGSLPPPDNKILGFYAPTPYLVGEGEIVTVDCDVIPDAQEKFLKVYFWNGNAYAMSGYCIITIETLEGVSEGQVIQVGSADERKYTYDEWLAIGQLKGKAITELQTDVLKGTSPVYSGSIAALGNQINIISHGFFEKYAALSNFPNAIPPNIPQADILKTVAEWSFYVRDLSLKARSDWILADNIISSLGGRAFSPADWLESIFGLEGLVKELYTTGFKTAVIPQVQRYFNKFYVPLRPSQNELINMVVKEKLTVDEFKVYMREQGLGEDWSQLIWDAHFSAPQFQDIRQAFWRGTISRENLEKYLKLVDLDPKFNSDVWLSLIENVPQYNDLINMRVKEVITQETFKVGLQAQGYFGSWADRLWDAHFTPASFTDFLTAMRRKLSVNIPVAEGTPKPYTFGSNQAQDIQTIKDLSILADYDPRYWDFFQTRLYNDPSYRMIMWGYEAGAITLDEIPDLVHRLGLNPKDESWYTKFLTTFQERPWITRYLTALQTAYTNGTIDEATLRSRVTEIPRNENIANWMVKIANLRKEAQTRGVTTPEQALISIAELKKAYVYGLLDEDNFRTQLMSRGFSVLDVDLLINIMKKETEIADVGGKKEGLTVAEYFDGWRYGELSEDDLRTALMTKGLNLQEVNILIETKKKKWGVGGVETQLS